jgi:hypothetical protein
MPYFEVEYRAGPRHRRDPDYEPEPPLRCVAVYAGPGQKLSTVMARFLGVRENELRRELHRIYHTEGLGIPRESTRDPRLQRRVRVPGHARNRRAYVLIGGTDYWVGRPGRKRTYRPPPSHLRREGNPRLGRFIGAVKV